MLCYLQLIKPYIKAYIVSGLLITGGDSRLGAKRSVEVWAPGPDSTLFSCYLPPMKRGRNGHTLTGSGLACGGYAYSYTSANEVPTCELWSNGSWVELDTRLIEWRLYHSAWLERSTNTTFLLGGLDRSTRSVETVSNEGKSDRADFVLAHNV